MARRENEKEWITWKGLKDIPEIENPPGTKEKTEVRVIEYWKICGKGIMFAIKVLLIVVFKIIGAYALPMTYDCFEADLTIYIR